jgi:branched-chain amino acid transport system permease protein
VKALKRFGWAPWLGFLVLPFGGWKVALGLTGAILVLILLTPVWEFLSRGLSQASKRLSESAGQAGKPLQTGSLVGFVILLLVLPLVLNRYFVDVAVLAGIYIVLALGLNIVVGLAGLLDLGYIAFYAVGAYIYALLWVHFKVPFWLGLPIGATVAAGFGLLLGTPVLRLRGDYLAIVTLGFGEITRLVINNWDEVTRGPNGILGIQRPILFGFQFRQPMHYYYLILAMVFLTIFVVRRLEQSRIGRAWVAVREDEIAARAMGVNVTTMKLRAFATGAAFAGLAGVFFAGKMTFISPESFTFMESVMILCMVVLGGMGSIPGVVLGAVLLIILPEALRQFQLYRVLVFGGAMAVMMVFRPQGLIPSKRRKMELVHEEK